MAKGQNTGGRWSEDEAREILAAWEKSGESGAAFARSLRVDPQRLFWWKRRLSGTSAPGGFAPVVIAPPTPTGASVVVTVRGADRFIEVHEVNGATAAWVAALLGRLAT